jgi:flagellar basal-body rod protein FlgF
MDRLIFTALSGQAAVAQRMQQISNEIANVSTTGFKRTFASAVQTYKYKGDGFESRYVSVVTPPMGIDMRPGAMQATGRGLDISLTGTQLLGVAAPEGGVAYTRRGDLQVSNDGTLRIGTGEAVVDEGGTPISIPPLSEVKVGTDGTVLILPQGGTAGTFIPLTRMQIVEPQQAKDIEMRPDGLYKPAAGKTFAAAASPSVQSGVLEGSNTNLFSTMVDMISMSRRYEMSVKVLKQASDLAERSQGLARLNQ